MLQLFFCIVRLWRLSQKLQDSCTCWDYFTDVAISLTHDLIGIGKPQKLLTLKIMTNTECAGKQSEARALVIFAEVLVGGVEM